MIAYNKTTLSNLRIIKKAKQWYSQKLLTTEQFAIITSRYLIGFYTPNIFIKIGLFLFTCVSISAALGLFCLMFWQAFGNNDNAFVVFLCLLFFPVCVLLLETFIKQKRMYKSGVDQALLYAALLFIGFGIGVLFKDPFNNTNNTFLFIIILIPILTAASIRYADILVTFCLSLCCYTIFFLLLLKLGTIAKVIMPFAFMVISMLTYLKTKQLDNKPNFINWQSCIKIFESVALIVFYLSGNYFVIRESSIQYFNLTLNNGQDIPLAIFLYLFTALVPIGYVYFGLKRKDKTLLWIGLLLIVVASLTFKNYFSKGHPEIIGVIVGIAMILIAYVAIKYLKLPKHGITFEEDLDEDNFLKSNAEALLLAQSFHQQTYQQPENTTGFGGGTGGGGGATGNW